MIHDFPCVRLSIRDLLIEIAVIAVFLSAVVNLCPIGQKQAFNLAVQHIKKFHQEFDFERDFTVSAHPPSDLGDEWAFTFDSRIDKESGFIVEVYGGDIYRGKQVRVRVDNAWGKFAGNNQW